MIDLSWLPYTDDRHVDAAYAYAKRDCAVFPLHGIVDGRCTCGVAECANEGKHPLERLAPRGFKDATTDLDRVIAWWQACPYANIGWALSSQALVLDEDPRHGGDRAREVLEREHGPLPVTLRQTTGSGGAHWIFRKPEGVHLVQRKVVDGLDTRVGGKGYIVVSPSLHKSTARYSWHSAVAPAPAPAWLIERLRLAVVAAPQAEFVPVVTGTLRASRRERFAKASIEGMARKVAAAGEGNRNEILNWAWHKAGGFADVVSKADARSTLLGAAIACGLAEREALKVLR